MSGERTESRGVLFADISDSTYIYETFGDEAARRIVLSCLDALRDVVAQVEGQVVDRIGDELMCTFPTADATARAAVRIQKRVDKLRFADDMPPDLSVRVGFHFGPVILDGDSIFGDTVYTAKRVSSLAKGRQIMTTGETLGQLEGSWELMARFAELTTLKGRKESVEIHRIDWDDPSITMHRSSTVPTLIVETELTVLFGKEEITLSKDRPVLTLGRGNRCDLIIDDLGVSREHARIEHRKGYFVLKDSSTNGTLIVTQTGENRTLHRDETRLLGSGKILLGPKEGLGVTFRCHPKGQSSG